MPRKGLGLSWTFWMLREISEPKVYEAWCDWLLLTSPLIPRRLPPHLRCPDSLALFQILRVSKLLPTPVPLRFAVHHVGMLVGCLGPSHHLLAATSPEKPSLTTLCKRQSFTFWVLHIPFHSVLINLCCGINSPKISVGCNNRHLFLIRISWAVGQLQLCGTWLGSTWPLILRARLRDQSVHKAFCSHGRRQKLKKIGQSR